MKMLSSPINPETAKNPTGWLFNNSKAINNILFSMQLHNLSSPSNLDEKILLLSDPISPLPDEIILQILSTSPQSQRNTNSLVSKRWLNLQGRLVKSLKLLDWEFLLSGRMFTRFPNLIHVDLVNASVIPPRNLYDVMLTNQVMSFHIDSDVSSRNLVSQICFLSVHEVELGLKILASRCPNLRKLVVVNACEMGLLSVADECCFLEELELHMCNDQVLRAIAAFQNLRTLKLIGNVDGIYTSLVSDLGLTILAQGCETLVKLELRGCGGSYEGMKAIGQCCQMLEELTLSDHRIQGLWLPALSWFENLKTLRFLSCKSIDSGLWADELLDYCPALERLHLERCQLRNKQTVGALFSLCRAVKEVVIKNCWGLDDEIFSTAHICRRVNYLSLEGCSRLTTVGLEAVILSWNELESLDVKSCNGVKESEIATLFSLLKDFKWRPDTKSLLSANLVTTGIWKRGKCFRKAQDWKFVAGA